jgi:hypothetical protein
MEQDFIDGSYPSHAVQIEVFDTDSMLGMFNAQQTTPFVPGQRISKEVAELLNAFPEVLTAIAFYQASAGAGAPTRFAPVVTPSVDPLVAAKAADVASHSPSDNQAARLISGWSIDSKTGEKKRLDIE